MTNQSDNARRTRIDSELSHLTSTLDSALTRNIHGMLLALDGGLTQDATMQLIAETQSINAPDYWLASAQNALAAWIRDDRGSAERALIHATTCSSGKTALFFGLLNARYGRFDATERWFREYLKNQSPQALSPEFTVVLDAAMLGLLGASTYERVSRQCNAWFEELCQMPERVEDQVVRWQSEIARQRESVSRPAEESLSRRFPALAGASPDWPRIMKWYRESTVYEPMKETLNARLAAQRVYPQAWRDRIDAIIHELQEIREPEEFQLRLQETELARIVEHKGDTAAAARAKAAEAPVVEQGVDLLTFLTNVALYPRSEVSPSTTQLAIHLAAPWISAAVTKVVTISEAELAMPVTVEIEGWQGNLGGEPIDTLGREFTDAVDRQTRKDIARERFAPWRLVGTLLTVAFVGALVVELIRRETVLSWLSAALVLLAILSACYAVAMHQRIPKRTSEVKLHGETRKERGLAALRAAAADRERLHADWNERIREADRLQEYVSCVGQPPLPAETLEERPRAEELRADPTGTEVRAHSPGSRAAYRRQPSFQVPEWSLEPSWLNRR